MHDSMGVHELLLLLAAALSIAAGSACGLLIGPAGNKPFSAVLGGAFAAVGTIPGLLAGYLVALFL